jgi:hypothetical protein
MATRKSRFNRLRLFLLGYIKKTVYSEIIRDLFKRPLIKLLGWTYTCVCGVNLNIEFMLVAQPVVNMSKRIIYKCYDIFVFSACINKFSITYVNKF